MVTCRLLAVIYLHFEDEHELNLPRPLPTIASFCVGFRPTRALQRSYLPSLAPMLSSHNSALLGTGCLDST